MTKPKALKTFPENATISDLYRPAMEITEQAEADIYLESLIQWGIRVGKDGLGKQTRNEATKIQKQNLGYFAGYYDAETMKRVNRLFVTTHPVFGNTTPAVEEAIEAGRKLASKKT